ncbi:TetR/AcrR family transcriptional regulator [Longimicrobium terrae]|nr:TetR/AcrR family transcriptional regulator [Longimicrobium terrae]
MSEKMMEPRERIVRAAAELLARGGREAVSTRAVGAAAGVQAPTIYRQFGDMRGLLAEVARETLAAYVREKAGRVPTDDPVEDLRKGWEMHVAFGLANPAAYALLYVDPVTAADAPAVRDGHEILHAQIERIARAGRLRVSVPLAARMVSAAGHGLTLSLIATPPEARDPRLPDAVRDAVLAAILVPAAEADEAAGGGVAARAVALRAVLPEAPGVLSPAEQHLMSEWLDRLAGAPAST